MEQQKRRPETPQEREIRIRNRELNDLKKILDMPEGRRFFWRLLEMGQLFHDGYVAGDNGYGSTRNLGTKRVGLWALHEMMDAKPSAFQQMQREHASESKREELVNEQYIEQKDIYKPDI